MHHKQAIVKQQDKKQTSDIRQAISEVFSCPNLPLYIYFKNFNFLINSELFNNYKSKDKSIYFWKQELKGLEKFDMGNKYAKFQILYDRINENPNRVYLQLFLLTKIESIVEAGSPKIFRQQGRRHKESHRKKDQNKCTVSGDSKERQPADKYSQELDSQEPR